MTNEYSYMKQIVDQVRSLKINNPEMEDELIDHFCTEYEELIKSTNNPDDKLSEIIDEIETLDLTHFRKNKKRMISRNLLIVCSFLLISTIVITNFINSEPDLLVGQDAQLEVAKVNFKADFTDPPYGSPIPNAEVVSGFGQRKHPISKKMKLHKGCDFKAALGTPVISVEIGTVTDCGFHDKYGFFIEIKHDDIYSTRYHHLSSIDVKKGEQIKKMQKIGKVGSTGLSTGPHLHYEIIKSGEWVDVAEYLKA